MMKKSLLILFSLLLALPAFADVDNLKFGGQVRLRQYDLQNFITYDETFDADKWNVFRLKTSLNASVDVEDTSCFIQFTNQNWGEGVDYTVSDIALDYDGDGTTDKTISGEKFAEDNKSSKTFLDSAYINIKKMGDTPLRLKLGRQNLMYGSGFVLFDGQSQMGSTSVYFDGLKLSWDISDGMVLDTLYFLDQENARDRASDDDVILSGLYFTMKDVIPGKQEIYILNKDDQGLEKNIWMIGLRASDKLDMGLDYSVEIAKQTGEVTDADIDWDALGIKLDLGYSIDAASKPRIYCQYVSLSGDDTTTADEYEGWDVFYGGWPQFGDLLAFVHVVPDNGYESTRFEADYTNFNLATIGLSLAPVEKVAVNLSAAQITVNETAAGVDDDFGMYYQLAVKYKFNKALGFKVYAATIDPGDAIGNGADNATEFFWEADFRF